MINFGRRVPIATSALTFTHEAGHNFGSGVRKKREREGERKEGGREGEGGRERRREEGGREGGRGREGERREGGRGMKEKQFVLGKRQ